jgi:hypothetical protein
MKLHVLFVFVLLVLAILIGMWLGGRQKSWMGIDNLAVTVHANTLDVECRAIGCPQCPKIRFKAPQ